MRFERQKIGDIRQIMLDFTLIQLKESVKSMEMLTTMYNDIAAIDETKDLEVITIVVSFSREIVRLLMEMFNFYLLNVIFCFAFRSLNKNF